MGRLILSNNTTPRLAKQPEVVYVNAPVEVVAPSEPHIVEVVKIVEVEKIVEVIKTEYITQQVEKIVYVDKHIEVPTIQEKIVIKEVPVEIIKEVQVPFTVELTKFIEVCPRWAMCVMACEAAIIILLTVMKGI